MVSKIQHIQLTMIVRLALLLGLAPALLLGTSATSASPTADAYVRIVHAAPSTGPVDVFLDGKSVQSGVAFGAVGSYMSVAAGSHTIKIAPAGKGIGSAVITQTVSFASGSPYTLAAVGSSSTGPGLQTFADNNVTSKGMASVRVYNLSPDAGSVNVATAGQMVISGLSYTGASNYIAVKPGSATFDVTPAHSSSTIPVNVTLQENGIGSIFAIGLSNGNPALKFVVGATTGAASSSLHGASHSVTPTRAMHPIR